MNMFVSAALTGSAIPPSAAAEADSIFAAIEKHKQASKVVEQVTAEIERLSRLADEEAGPLGVQVLDMREPSFPPGCHMLTDAYCVSDIDELVPGNENADLRLFYDARLAEKNKARAEIMGDVDAMMEQPALDLWAAEEALTETVPTTLAGLLATLAYAGEIVSADPYAHLLDEGVGVFFISNLAKAARTLRGTFG